LKDSELTAITGVDGGRGGAVEGDVVINGETTLSCIMSLIRKFYQVVLIVELTTVAVFFALKNLQSALACVFLCLCLCFLSKQLCANSQGAPVNSVPSMRVKLEDMIWLSGTRAANTRHVTIH
jgi:hypothetical protein